MNVEIFIVSYLKDKPWLEYCLRSIDRFCGFFSGVTVLVPEQEVEKFKDLHLSNHEFRLRSYDRNYPESHWHLGHQVEKCFADKWCPDANYILHTDSDCIFTEPVTPEDYFVGSHPVLLIESYNHMGFSNWKLQTEQVMGETPRYETMRRHPAVHHRGVYPDLRAHVERVQHKGFREFVMSRKADFPWGFSEFNALGQIALSAKWSPDYEFIDVELRNRPHDKIHQFWSHWGVDGTITDQGPYFGQKPRDIMERILK